MLIEKKLKWKSIEVCRYNSAYWKYTQKITKQQFLSNMYLKCVIVCKIPKT